MPNPGPATPTTTTTIGNGLYAETFAPAGAAKGAVVVTHGYAEHCGRYREVANVIAQAGWAVLTYDVRGHGKSPGPRGYIDRFSTYLADQAAAEAAARRLAPDGSKLVLLGHSHGSLIVLRALTGDAPHEAAAAIVSSPFLALAMPVSKPKIWLGKIASRVAPKLSQPNHFNLAHLTSDPEKQKERAADTLCFDSANSRWFTEASDAQDYVYARADRVAIPTTWIVGGADPIASPARSRAVAAKVRGADYHELAGFVHEVFNETKRAEAFAFVVAALAKV